MTAGSAAMDQSRRFGGGSGARAGGARPVSAPKDRPSPLGGTTGGLAASGLAGSFGARVSMPVFTAHVARTARRRLL
jgi:hypothetical protein